MIRKIIEIDEEKCDGCALCIPGCPEGALQIIDGKLKHLINDAKINTLTVFIMQVPCCSGLLQMAQQALAQSSLKVPLQAIVVGVQGDILQEDWVS